MTIPLNKQAALRQYLAASFPNSAVAVSQIEGFRNAIIEGIDENVTLSGTHCNIWRPGGIYPYPTSGQQLEILSDDTNDTLAGSGAQKVIVFGLDSNWVEIFEILDMDGTTEVLTTGTDWFRINRIQVLQSGSSFGNEGDLMLQVAGGGDVLGEIAPMESRSRACLASIAVGTTAMLTGVRSDIPELSGQTASAEFGLYVRDHSIPGPTWVFQLSWAVRSTGSSHMNDLLIAPIVVPSMSDVEIRITKTTGNGIHVSASMEGFSFDNDVLNPAPL